VFAVPYFAGTYSFFDSLYSTFWGDAYLGGTGSYADRPPWNYEYMSAVYLLAIPAALAIIIGMVLAIGNMIRTADKIWLLILGSFFTMACSIIYMGLQVPYYGIVKAFYGLGVILPIGLIFAFGFDWLDQRLRDKKLSLLRMVLYGWFGTLIMAILLSFFISSGQANAVYYSNLDVRATHGELDQAVAYYTQILHSNPEDWYAHCQLAEAYFLQHEYDKAIEHYSQTIRIKPDYFYALNGLGRAFYNTGKIDQAASCFNAAMQIAPDSADAYLNLGFILADMGKLKEAAEEYEKLLLIQPDNAVAHNDLGVVLIRQGEINEAITHFSQAVRIDPQYSDAKNSLNAALAEKQKSPN
jgi:tetratricopeptide (TPR) repeat protein